jgi:GlpG protein
MRQIGNISGQTRAERFTAYLITQEIAAQAENDGDQWVIWVRDEDQLERARDAFLRFTECPDDPRYDGVVREANSMLQAEMQRREQARKNHVQMRGRWNRPAARKAPLVTTIVVLCIAVFVLSGFGTNAKSAAMRSLMFCDTMQKPSWDAARLEDRLIDISHGQVWRVVTPIFLHGTVMHLVFNMIMFFQFGARIEDRRGAWRLGGMILVIAVVSNAAQGLAPSDWGQFSGGPQFLGMSGVVFGLLGYLWMKTLYEPELGLTISGGTVMFFLGFMLLCFTGVLDSLIGARVANLAHAFGLLAGMAVGFVPTLLKR